MDPILAKAIQALIEKQATLAPGVQVEPEHIDEFIRSKTGDKYGYDDYIKAVRPPSPGADAGVLRSALDHVADGVLGGLGEKIGAAGASLLQHGNMDNYRFNLDAMHQRFANERASHPVASAAGEVGGLVASPINRLLMSIPGLGPAAADATMTGKMLQAAKVGAASGAIYGAGSGNGTAASTAANAAAGGVTGGVVGAAAQPILSAAAPVARALAVKLGFVPAEQTVVRALAEQGLDPQAVAKAPPAMLANILPDLARTVRTMSSKARTVIDPALDAQKSQQLPVIQNELEQGLGVPRGDMQATSESLAASKAAQAKPLYDAAYAGAPISDPDVLSTIKNTPQLVKAYERGRGIARIEGVKLPPLPKNVSAADVPVPESIKGTTGEAPFVQAYLKANPQKMPSIPIQGIDYMKRGVNDMVESGMRSGNMGRQEARALQQLLYGDAVNGAPGLLAKVDAASPEYAAARANFAGHSEAQAAIERGKEFPTASADDVRDALRETPSSLHDLYRRSAMNTMLEKLESARGSANGSTDLLSRFYSSVGGQNKVRALFPNDATYSTFHGAMNTLAEQNASARFIQSGSQTADKTAAAQNFGDADAAHSVAKTIRSPFHAVKSMLADAAERSLRVGSVRHAERLAPQLVAQGGDLQGVLAAMQRTPNPAVRDALMRQLTASKLGSTASTVGSPLLAGLFSQQ